MEQITKWRPDTCECEIEYAWDDTLPQEERVHTPVATKPCAAHTVPALVARGAAPAGASRIAGNARHEVIFNAVVQENQKKNYVIGKLMESADLAEDTDQPDGTKSRFFKQGMEPEWSIDPETRAVKIRLKGTLSAAKKTALRNLLKKDHADVTVE